MLIDLHNHTATSSPCSIMEAEELIAAALDTDLDAICVTDHHFIEGAEVAQALGREFGFPVFKGIEVTSDHGDMLVFGCYRDIRPGIALEDLRELVDADGGVIFAAHPFHEWGGATIEGTVLASGLKLLVDWRDIPELDLLDGLEVLNGQVKPANNDRARTLAGNLGLPGIAGSDAHSVDMVGRAATRFPHAIETDEELVAALKSGDYQPVRLGIG